MRYGAKRLISLLTALVMVCSLIVTPAAAVENTGAATLPAEEESTDTVNPPAKEGIDAPSADADELSGATAAPAAEEDVIVDLKGLYSYDMVRMAMYANDRRNTKDGLMNLETTLKGIVRGTGETVEVTVKWTWKNPDKYSPKGYAGYDTWRLYEFESARLSVKGHPNYQIIPGRLVMQLMVVAVTGAPVFTAPSHSVDRTTVLNWEDDSSNWKNELGLPTEVEIVYKPVGSRGSSTMSEWIELAGEFRQENTTATIDYWYMRDYSAELTGWNQIWNAVRGGGHEPHIMAPI